MYKYVLESVDNIDFYGIAGLLIFFTFFTLHVIVTLMKSQKEMDDCSAIPMDDGTIDNIK